MLFAARQVHERVRELGIGHDAEVAVDAGVEPDARLRVALPYCGFDSVEVREEVHELLRARRRGNDVDVPDDFLAATEAAGDEWSVPHRPALRRDQ